MTQKRKLGKLDTEGDTLVYKVTGEGIPILLIPGGGGDGDLYLPLADALAQYQDPSFCIITYDRRANARSTANFPDQFDLSQQARDATAILDALHLEAAYLFGNSSGAVIALHMEKEYPTRVLAVIAHEPPLARLHPQSGHWRHFFQSCCHTANGPGGPSIAATRFLFGIQVPVLAMIRAQSKAMSYIKGEPQPIATSRIPSKQASRYLITQELLPITDYKADIEHIKKNKSKYRFAAGTYAQQHHTFLYQIIRSISATIDQNYTIVPGHHASFMDDTAQWASAIQTILHSFTDHPLP